MDDELDWWADDPRSRLDRLEEGGIATFGRMAKASSDRSAAAGDPGPGSAAGKPGPRSTAGKPGSRSTAKDTSAPPEHMPGGATRQVAHQAREPDGPAWYE